jgi:pyruvate/2-oxoacid:ferredoxin oxidoreductase beta subunit
MFTTYLYLFFIFKLIFLGNKGELKSRLQEYISSNDNIQKNLVINKENIQENCNIVKEKIDDKKNVDKIVILSDSEKIRKNMVHMDAMINRNNTINYITVNNDDDIDI